MAEGLMVRRDPEDVDTTLPADVEVAAAPDTLTLDRVQTLPVTGRRALGGFAVRGWRPDMPGFVPRRPLGPTIQGLAMADVVIE